jgi:hypothetical protein
VSGAGVLSAASAITLGVVLWRWWQSPWCAVCYRAWAWRQRVVHKRWGVPEAMHVCGRCARELDAGGAHGR